MNEKDEQLQKVSYALIGERGVGLFGFNLWVQFLGCSGAQGQFEEDKQGLVRQLSAGRLVLEERPPRSGQPGLLSPTWLST